MGVIPRNGRWAAKFSLDGRQLWLGTFDTEARAQQELDEVRGAVRKRGLIAGMTWMLFTETADDRRRYRRAVAGDPCAYCGAASEQVDHVHPRAGGGLDGWENLAGTCAACNSGKKTLPILSYLLVRLDRATIRRAEARIAHLREPMDFPHETTRRRGLRFSATTQRRK